MSDGSIKTGKMSDGLVQDTGILYRNSSVCNDAELKNKLMRVTAYF